MKKLRYLFVSILGGAAIITSFYREIALQRFFTTRSNQLNVSEMIFCDTIRHGTPLKIDEAHAKFATTKMLNSDFERIGSANSTNKQTTKMLNSDFERIRSANSTNKHQSIEKEEYKTKRLWQQTFLAGTFAIPDDMLSALAKESPSPVGKLIAKNIRFPDLKPFWEGVFHDWPHENSLIENGVISSQGDVMSCSSLNIWPSRGCSSAPTELHCRDGDLSFDMIVVITQLWGSSYFHAFVEDLSRLAFVLHVRESLPQQTRIHVADENSALLQKLVQFYGPWQLVSGQVQARQILLPPSTPCGGHVYSAYNSMFRASIHARLGPADESEKRLVVMHRKVVSSGSRIILNHDALVQALRSAWGGLVSEHFGNEPLHDQWNLFRCAEAVVGPHGASLANIVAMRPGKAVVELLPVSGVNKLNPCYMSMSFTLGLRYFTFYEASSHSESNWEVSIPKVLEILSEI